MTYSISDLKWGTPTLGESSGVIRWYADLDSTLDYNEAIYDQADFDSALVAAMDAWEAVAAVDFEPAANAGAADLSFGMGPLAGSAVGTASISYFVLPGTDQITEASVTFDSNEVWSPYGSGALDFYAVALHEIGHAIGLRHVNDTSEIMNPVISTDELGDGDVAGARALYGADPGDIAPPSSGPPPGGGGGGGGGGSDTSGSFFSGAFDRIFDLIARIFGVGGGSGTVTQAGATSMSDADAEAFMDLLSVFGDGEPELVTIECDCACHCGHDHEEFLH